MGLGDENLGIPQGLYPQGQNPLASLLQAIQKGQGGQGPGAGGGTQVQPIMQSPNIMSPTQAGGPIAAPRAQRPEQQPAPVDKNDKIMGAISAGMQGLGAGLREAKQRKFEQEASMASVFTAAQIAEEKQKAGLPLSQQELQSIKMANNPKLASKKDKLMEKAMTDPMSGAYVGTQRTYKAMQDAAVQNQEIQAKIENMKAQQAERAALAGKATGANETALGVAGIREQGQVGAAQIKATTDQQKEQNRLITQGALKGEKVTFDEQGKATSTPYTQKEIDTDPMLKTQQSKEIAATDAMIARVRQGDLRNRIAEERVQMQHQLLDLRALHESKLPDQSQGKQPKLNSMEQNRADLANIGGNYISKMTDIVNRRPDLFGPGPWGQNKYKTALGDKDKDAMDFQTYSEMAAPAIANMHGRNAALVKEMRDFISTFYQNPQTTLSKLGVEAEAMKMIRDTGGGRPGGAPGNPATSTPAAGGSSSDPFAQFGGKSR